MEAGAGKSLLLAKQRSIYLPSQLWGLFGVRGEHGTEQGQGGTGQGQTESASHGSCHPSESCQGRDPAEVQVEARTHITGRKRMSEGDWRWGGLRKASP